MDHPPRLHEIWRWLPSFQAVATTQHLPTASREVGVSPSALSRTMRHLEASAGRALFERRGRRLVLNAEGQKLLDIADRAFLLVTRGLMTLDKSSQSRVFRVNTWGSLAEVALVEALRSTLSADRSIHPVLGNHPDAEAVDLLRSHRIDLALGPTPIAGSDLVTMPLGAVEVAVFAGRGHRLFDHAGTPEELAAASFVSIARSGEPVTRLGDLDLRVGAEVEHARVALDLCVAGHFLAVFELPVARALEARGDLRRLAAPALPASVLCATWSTTSPRLDLVEELVTSIRRLLPEGGPARAKELVGVAELDLVGAERTGSTNPAKLPPDGAGADARSRVRDLLLALVDGSYERVARDVAETWIELEGPEARALAASAAMLGATFCGDLALAGAWRQRGALALAESSTPTMLEARALFARADGNLAAELGKHAASLVAFERALEAAAELGDPWERSVAVYNRAEALARLGDGESAWEQLESADGQKRAIDDRWGLSYVALLRARLALVDGRSGVALEYLRSGQMFAAQLGDPRLRALLGLTLGLTLLATADLDGAARELTQTLAGASLPGVRAIGARCALALAAVHLERAEPREARSLHKMAVTLAGARLGAEIAESRAEIAFASGNAPTATRHLRRALATGGADASFPSPFRLRRAG